MEKKKVKERQHMKAPKAADASRRISRHMKTGYRKVDEQTTPTDERYESESDYATQKSEQYTYEVASVAYSGTKKAVKKVKEKVEDKIRNKVEYQAYSKDPEGTGMRAQGAAKRNVSTQENAEILQKQRFQQNEFNPTTNPALEDATQKGGDQHALQQAERQSHSVENNQRLFRSDQRSVQKTNAAGQRSVSSVKQGAKGTIKTTEKTVKTTEKSVKTADRSVKTAEKSVKTAEKVGEKAAKAAEKAAKVAKEVAVKAAKAAEKAAEMTAKAIQAAVKAIIAAIKALVAAIAAGGWVAIVIILFIALVAAIICVCFGLFWSNDTSQEGTTMTEIITRIDQSYKDAIDKRIKKFEKEIDHDEFEVVYRGDNNDGDSATVNNWIDVLAVYSVLSTTGENPIIILVPDDECEQRLRDVFSVMNTVGFTYELHEVVPGNAPTPTPDKEGNTPEPETVTQLIVNVHQRSMTYREAAEYFHFDESQMQLLEEMMSPAYTKYYAALIGVDLLGGADYTEIISHLPSNNKGADVVRAALTKLGCPYVWGAKGSTKFDCSGLAYWAIHEVDPELGDHMYTNAAGQAKYCYDRGLLVAWSELEPGDLVFWVNKKCEGCHRWKEIHHVGIYVGDGKVVEASSSKGCVVVRDLWQTKNYPIIMFGRPYQ